MLNHRSSLKIFIVTLASLMMSHCGGVSTTKSERTAEQPQEVAGGFGLTCLAIETSSDSSSTKFGCVFEDKSGQKFQEYSNIKALFSVRVSDRVIPVTTEGLDSKYNYTFTVPQQDINSVQIEAKFLNPEAANAVLSDKSSSLTQALTLKCDLAKFRPSFISATGGDSQVVLKWQPTGDAALTKGYYMRYWEGSDFSNSTPPKTPSGAVVGHYPPNQQLITDTTATVTGLQNGKTYTFGVIAYEPTRCGSGWETFISATTKAP